MDILSEYMQSISGKVRLVYESYKSLPSAPIDSLSVVFSIFVICVRCLTKSFAAASNNLRHRII